MNIWIDITNSPHVNFFNDFIKEWNNEHNIVITTRNYSNTLDILKIENIEYHIIGKHYGKNIPSKVFGFFFRCISLVIFLRKKNIHLAISQSSFYSPIVAYLLGVKSIYTNDNEHAKGNYIGFIFSSIVLLPEALKKWSKNRFFIDRTEFYPGIKEGIYLKSHKNNLNNKIKTIYFRPEPWDAQYHKANLDYYNNMIFKLSNNYSIIIIPRNEKQFQYFKAFLDNTKISILKDSVGIDILIKNCDFFIGAGGSMNRELSLSGIPTISVYNDKLLEVDKLLIKNGILFHETNIDNIDKDYIDNIQKLNIQSYEYRYKLIKKGKNARAIINNLINISNF